MASNLKEHAGGGSLFVSLRFDFILLLGFVHVFFCNFLCKMKSPTRFLQV